MGIKIDTEEDQERIKEFARKLLDGDISDFDSACTDLVGEIEAANVGGREEEPAPAGMFWMHVHAMFNENGEYALTDDPDTTAENFNESYGGQAVETLHLKLLAPKAKPRTFQVAIPEGADGKTLKIDVTD